MVLHSQQTEIPLSLTEVGMRRQFSVYFLAQRASGKNSKLCWEGGSNGLCFEFSLSQHEEKPRTSAQRM